MATYDLTFEVNVRLTVHDELVIRRVLENHDADGNPQPRRDIREGGRGWQDTLYDLPDRDAVLSMLGRCVGIKGWNLSSLDGWADMSNEAVDAHEMDHRLLYVDEIDS